MYNVAVLTVVLSIVAGGTAAAWLLTRHDPPSSAFLFGGFLLVLTIWTATHLGTLFAETVQWLLLFKQLSYLGVVSTPVAWFAFAIQYTHRGEWLSRHRLALLSVVPATTLAMVFTAQHHSLFYTSISLGAAGGHPVLLTESGPFHVVNVVYSYALLLGGTGLLARAALSDNRLYRRQSAVLLVCITVPWAVNASYHLGWRLFPEIDPTPMAFIATGIPLALLVLRTDLASFLPVAHERVFRSLDDPMLVVAPGGKVIDANDAARTVLGGGESVEGDHVGGTLPAELLDDGALRTDLDGPVECTVDHDDGTRQYLGRRQSVDPDRTGVSRGSVVALTDITARKARERELEQLSRQTQRKNEQLERMADVVAHDMQAPVSTADKILTLLEGDLDEPDPDVRRSLDDLASVLNRLDAFADHIPRLARESTDVETVQPCDLERLARDAWEVVETRDVSLTVVGTRELEADRRRLLQVFENLFGNAIEHGVPADEHSTGSSATDGGGARHASHDGGIPGRAENAVVTTVRVGPIDGGFYVEDDGPGVPPEQRDDVFRYGVSTGDGSGFGLAIARTVVEAHGWEIVVTDSELARPHERADGAGTATESAGARFEIRTA